MAAPSFAGSRVARLRPRLRRDPAATARIRILCSAGDRCLLSPAPPCCQEDSDSDDSSEAAAEDEHNREHYALQVQQRRTQQETNRPVVSCQKGTSTSTYVARRVSLHLQDDFRGTALLSFAWKGAGIFVIDVYDGTSSECKLRLDRRSSSFSVLKSDGLENQMVVAGEARNSHACSDALGGHSLHFSRRITRYMYLIIAKSPCLYHASMPMCPEIRYQREVSKSPALKAYQIFQFLGHFSILKSYSFELDM
nr:uncharacterized protein LOC109733445 [Aegilops tauschii subsp. strangulata]